MKYTLDTNIFIDGFRNEDAQAEVFASAVVMQELAAGARTAEAARDVCLPHPAQPSPRAAVFSRPSLHGKGGNYSTKSRRS